VGFGGRGRTVNRLRRSGYEGILREPIGKNSAKTGKETGRVSEINRVLSWSKSGRLRLLGFSSKEKRQSESSVN